MCLGHHLLYISFSSTPHTLLGPALLVHIVSYVMYALLLLIYINLNYLTYAKQAKRLMFLKTLEYLPPR